MTGVASDAFVTGASGFLGRHLVRSLLAQGRRVRALCRPGSATLPIADGNAASVVEGDLENPHSYRSALTDRMNVFHLAAVPSSHKSA